ncbi:hypothetical protein [Parendozoicomonas sp. Alg238-R29]|uniref:hypothetical protein n=1 Tax=Parendozoicomonas sp. Alg238-R29 TaxID=2993446 RepID=UPI00248E482F|nr:hypothetical protein [Parendozoicomonas sp. Alg238-R29]
MPGIQSPKIDSSRLLLTASIAVSTQAMASTDVDNFRVLGGALAGSNGFASSPQLQEILRHHPEWGWLPSYKIESLSKTPYTFADRAYEAISGEIMPLLTIVALHSLSTTAGLQFHQLWRANPEKVADYAWRFGEAIGDLATTDTVTELMWRLFATNADFFKSPDFADSQNGAIAWRLLKRGLAYSYMIGSNIPDALRQHVVNSVGFVGIPFETASLNKHFALTFISSSTADDPGRPDSAYLDLDFVNQPKPFDDPKGRFEEALVALDKASRTHNVTRIRLYPSVMGDQRKGGELALFIRPYFNHQPGPLVRFPARFGSSSTRIWWTDAMDRGILERTYNDDQYSIVKYLNSLMDYKSSVITPLSDGILEKLPGLIEWASNEPIANDYGFNLEQQKHTAAEPDVVDTEDDLNLGYPGKPKQSMNHTVIQAGKKKAFLFMDGHYSQGAELPIMVMVTRSSSDDVKTATLLELEKHMPWLQYRGSYKIAFTWAKGQAYSWVVQRLMMVRSKQFKAQQEMAQRYIKNMPDSFTASDMATINQLGDEATQGMDPQEALEQSMAEIQELDEYNQLLKLEGELKDLEAKVPTKQAQSDVEKAFSEAQENLERTYKDLMEKHKLTPQNLKAARTLKDEAENKKGKDGFDAADKSFSDYLKSLKLQSPTKVTLLLLQTDYKQRGELTKATKDKNNLQDRIIRAQSDIEAKKAARDAHITSHETLVLHSVLDQLNKLGKSVEADASEDTLKGMLNDMRKVGQSRWTLPGGSWYETKAFFKNLVGSIPVIGSHFGPEAELAYHKETMEKRAQDAKAAAKEALKQRQEKQRQAKVDDELKTIEDKQQALDETSGKLLYAITDIDAINKTLATKKKELSTASEEDAEKTAMAEISRLENDLKAAEIAKRELEQEKGAQESELEQQKAELQGKIEHSKQLRAGYTAVKAEREQVKEELDETTARNTTLAENIKNHEQQLAQTHEDYEQEKQAAEALAAQHSKTNKKRDETNKRLQDAETRANNLKNQHATAKANKKQLQKELKQLTAGLDTATDKSSIKELAEDLQSQVSDAARHMADLESQVKTADDNVAELTRRSREEEAKSKTFKADHQKAITELENLRAKERQEREALTKAKTAHQTANERIKTLEGNFAQMQDTISEFENTASAAEIEYKGLAQRLDDENQEAQQLRTKQGELEGKTTELKTELEKAESELKDLEPKLKTAREAEEKQTKEFNGQLESIQAQRNELYEEIKQLQEEIGKGAPLRAEQHEALRKANVHAETVASEHQIAKENILQLQKRIQEANEHKQAALSALTTHKEAIEKLEPQGSKLSESLTKITDSPIEQITDGHTNKEGETDTQRIETEPRLTENASKTKELENAVTTVQGQIDNLQSQLDSAQTTDKKIDAQLEEANTTVKRATDAAKDSINSHRQLEQKIRTAKQNLEEVTTEITSIDQKKQTVQDHWQHVEQHHKNVSITVQNTRTALQSSEAETEQAKQQVVNKQAALENLSADKSQAEQKLATTKSHLNNTQTDVQGLKTELQKARESLSKESIPEWKDRVSQLTAELQETERKANQLDDQARTAQSQHLDLELQLIQHKDDTQRLNRELGQAKTVQQELERKAHEATSAGKVAEQLAELEEKVTQLADNRDNADSSVSSVSTELETVEAELKELKDLKAARDKTLQIETELHNANSEVERLRSEKKTVSSQLGELEKKHSALKETQKKLNQEAREAKRFAIALKGQAGITDGFDPSTVSESESLPEDDD